jgi:hypothetical protein
MPFEIWDIIIKDINNEIARIVRKNVHNFLSYLEKGDAPAM